MRNTPGYTLLEIMICVGIIGILLLGVVISYTKYIERSQAISCRGNAKLLYSALNEYAVDHMIRPGTDVALTNLYPRYLSTKAELTCPHSGQSYSSTLTVGSVPQCPESIPEHAWSPHEDIGL